jgi:hypothetical protein
VNKRRPPVVENPHGNEVKKDSRYLPTARLQGKGANETSVITQKTTYKLSGEFHFNKNLHCPPPPRNSEKNWTLLIRTTTIGTSDKVN